jgi:phage regulator Rha-like protein
MQDLSLNLVKNEFRIDSRLLAPELNHRHRTILESLDKYKSQFESLGLLTVESEARLQGQHGGGDVRYFLLNEDQCYFLLTLMRNNDKIVSAKLKLVKAFRDSRKQLAERDIARLDGKEARKLETSAIKDLIDYAKAHGSGSADKYYVIITKMTNTALGIEAGQRNTMDSRQLQLLKLAETLVEVAIRDGLKAELDYKDIYRLCKDRVSEVIHKLTALKFSQFDMVKHT